ncbi:hypothetical protein ACT3CE_17745 [Marinifilum sp. RC60d5]|uniref:hypothetical protein n=1 Tax=Marinifilum sp. RC60d5 TaxID=3458414 RepID=UPI004036895D
MHKKNIAIVVITYNRLNSLKRLLLTLKEVNFSNDKIPLYISIDYSGNDIIEKYCDEFIWPHGEKIVIKHAENLGLKRHILSTGDLLSAHDALVVLEDDLVVSNCMYNYIKQSVVKYSKNKNIAGVSLYSFAVNYQNWKPFNPVKNEYDAYAMNCAQSWGQIWFADQWFEFKNWLLQNKDFAFSDKIPQTLMGWTKSWLKYHTRYCIEKNKYFIYPYVSLSSPTSEAGVHSKEEYSQTVVALQDGNMVNYRLPLLEECIKYDGFFENKNLYSFLNKNHNELCLDLNNTRNKYSSRYILTMKSLPFRVEKSYGLNLFPSELNVLRNINGTGIFLYDTLVVEKKPIIDTIFFGKYTHRFNSLKCFMKDCGIIPLLKSFIKR